MVAVLKKLPVSSVVNPGIRGPWVHKTFMYIKFGHGFMYQEGPGNYDGNYDGN